MTQKTTSPAPSDKPYVSSPMNELERKLHYPLGETMPETEVVRPDLHQPLELW